MSSSIAESAAIIPEIRRRLNPAELKIDLLCRGLRIDGTCRVQAEGRPVCSSPGDMGSGLELILPGEISELWVNVPVLERFAEDSPYYLLRASGEYHLFDERYDLTYHVKLAPRLEWYDSLTRRGTPMSQVGVVRGTVLSIDVGRSCRFWNSGPSPAGTGKKSIEDVVETAATARRESGITFTLLRGACSDSGELAGFFPYVKALKEEVGILVGMQCPPVTDLEIYEKVRAIGIDHISFCMEFYDQGHWERYAPDKPGLFGRQPFAKAIESCVHVMGKARVSGEVIAGLEPVEDTLRAIDYLVGAGALPLILILRPLPGTDLEHCAPPGSEEMMRVFRHVYEACRTHNLPLGITPNIHLSVIPHPEDTLYLASDSGDGRAYQRWIFTVKQVMRPYFLRRMRRYSTPLPDRS